MHGSLPGGSYEKGAVRNAKEKGVFLGSLQTCRNIILNFLCLGPGVLAHIFNPKPGWGGGQRQANL